MDDSALFIDVFLKDVLAVLDAGDEDADDSILCVNIVEAPSAL